jgi:trimeric autotransporter adhesin
MMPHKLIRLIPLLIICFALLPKVQAVGPDTDGAIAGANNGEGIGVLVSRTTGIWNTGTGFEALNNLTSGNQNTATGLRALASDINGGFNTATGVSSLISNTAGFFNTATGAYSLANNVDGDRNTADGYAALFNNTEADGNTAIGRAALYHNTTGDANVAIGESAAFPNTTGNFNTAIGQGALFGNTSGNNNIAIGFIAGGNFTTASNAIAIGSGGLNISNSCFIGNIYSNVQPAVGIDPDFVTVTSSGRLGRANVSSRRYKHDIKPMDKASEALFALKPVSFRYNKEYDATQTLAFGLIAEEVAKVYPDLVGRNAEGQPESVRYDQVNAMLLNEFLKEHRKVEAQEATIAELKSTVAQQQKGMDVLTAQLKEHAAQIQKVSAQLETSKPAPKVVVNTP